MGIASKYNRGSIFNCNTEGFEYFSLKDLFDNNGADYVYEMQGLYINRKSEYGDAPVAILKDCFANLPQHLLEVCQDMLSDQAAIDQIKAGLFGFMIEEYESDKKKGKDKTCYGIKWMDLDD